MSYLPGSGCVVSGDNSSTALLTDTSVFTGTWEDVSAYDSVTVAVKTDQNGYFSVQFSPDGTNQDSTLTRYYNTADIEAPHRFTITRKFCRVVFTNDSGSDQTYLRLQTMLGTKGDLNAPLDSILARDFDATAVRPSDFHSEVALGRRQGVSLWNKFGFNTDVDTGGEEIVASWGGTFQYLTAGETIDIVSDSTSDDGDPAGIGVQQVVVTGVDENWDPQVEVVTMNGTTTVTTSTQWIGINRVAIFLSGSFNKNAGNITVTATTSGYTMAQMPAEQGVTQQCVFYVPANHQFLAEWLWFTALKLSGGGGSPEITIEGHVYSAINQSEQQVFKGQFDTARNNHLEASPPVPFPVGEKSILWFGASTDTNNTSVSGRFSGELHKDPDA